MRLIPVLILAGLALALWFWHRQSALRAWRRYAEILGGEFKAANRLSPDCVCGTLRDRPFTLEIATGHEDDAPYYHTRASLPLRNSAGFILGLRRKSLLEEAQTRRESPPYDLQDPDFERLFFLICNDIESLQRVLTRETRRELLRYSDIEVYARLDRIEWRRAGEQSDLKVIQRLNESLADMAESVDSLPARARGFAQRQADEALIAKGI